MPTISLCMIVKDEENTLARCLSCAIGAVDEIVILDTGSTDRTKEIARRFTDRVYDFTWIDDFSAARNAAYAYATMDYILWLDADDVLPPAEAAKLVRFKETLTEDAVMFSYATQFDAAGRPSFLYGRERLSRRERGFLWCEPVHEYLAVSGTVVKADITVYHAKRVGGAPDSGRNLRIYERQIASGRALTPRGMYYYARELRDNGRLPEAAEAFSRFLDTNLGWTEDNISACAELARIHQAEGQPSLMLPALFRSFCYDLPRAEILCQIGYFFQEKRDFRRAAYWFELALSAERPQNPIGFTRPDCWGYTPAIELAVCYDKLGDIDRAERFNALAAGHKPDSPAATYNQRYFAQRRNPAEKEE